MYLRPGFVCRPPLLVTWNPGDKSSNINLPSGNLTATVGSTGDGGVRATKVRGAGKWYCEINMSTAISDADTGIGLAAGDPTFASIASNATHAFVQFHNGITYLNGANSFNGISITSGGVLGVAYDGGAHLAWLTGDGVHWNSTGGSNDPAAGTGGASVAAFDSGGLYPVFVGATIGEAAILNAGKTTFSFTAPVGFSNWNAS